MAMKLSINGLPFQSVQFQSMATTLRLICSSHTLTEQEKKQQIQEQAIKIMDATFANAVFWINQAKDGDCLANRLM